MLDRLSSSSSGVSLIAAVALGLCFWTLLLVFEGFVRAIFWALVLSFALRPLKAKLLELPRRRHNMLVTSVMCLPGEGADFLVVYLRKNAVGFLVVVLAIASGKNVEHLWTWTPPVVRTLQRWMWSAAAEASGWLLQHYSKSAWMVAAVFLALAVACSRHCHLKAPAKVLASLFWTTAVFASLGLAFSAATAAALVAASCKNWPLSHFLNYFRAQQQQQHHHHHQPAENAQRQRQGDWTDSEHRVFNLVISCVVFALYRYQRVRGVMAVFVLLTCGWILSRVVLFMSLLRTYMIDVWATSSDDDDDECESAMGWPLVVAWNRVKRADAALHATLRTHADTIGSLLLVAGFVVGVVGGSALLGVAVYKEAETTTKQLWFSRNEYVPAWALVLANRTRDYVGKEVSERITEVFSRFTGASVEEVVVALNESDGLRQMLGDSSSVMEMAKFLPKFVFDGPMFFLKVLIFAFQRATSVLTGFIVFVSALYLFVQGRQGPLEWLHHLSVKNAWGERVRRVQKLFAGVFLNTLLMALFHGLFTWIACSAVSSSWTYSASSISFFVSMFPFVGSYWAAFPAVVELFFNGNAARAVWLFCSHLFVYWFADSDFYSDTRGAHPFFAALAAVGGLMSFGVEGVVIGPLVLALVWDEVK